MSIQNIFFLDTLEAHGDQTALICEDGTKISYRTLATRADDFARDLIATAGQDRGLLMIEMESTAQAVVAYVGAARARWPVILAAPGTGSADSDLVTRFKPDVVYHCADGAWQMAPARGGKHAHDLHADLGVMLSTSGSTGSAKLVRLSRGNIHANAGSIAQYLAIDATRVTVTNLPLHYSYGLSVLNSFLLSGAAVVLSDMSVLDDAFHDVLARDGVTDLAGVPSTYDLLERAKFRDHAPASLRVMTQAGGRLPPDMVSKYAQFAKDRDLQFFVMYGQTEATARMAYLPPDQALSHAASIGIAIPGGSFTLQDADGAEITERDVAGELIYRGPNVMMGYGETPADLALGAQLDALPTGDIALREASGFYRIVGRSSRFSKIAGLRIGFDDVEGLLRADGMAGYTTGTDETLVIALSAGDADAARQHISTACGLPATAVFVWRPDEMPVLSSGKIDYQSIRKTGLSLKQAQDAAQRATGKRSVARLFSQALNQAHPDPAHSFVELGGDSLAYLTISMGLEDALGTVPDRWEDMPISALQGLADVAPVATGPARLTIGTDVVLRLLAISIIFIGHAAPSQTEFLRGGSSVLFCLAGYSMALVQLPQLMQGRVVPIFKGIVVRLILPYFILVTLLLVASDAKPSISWYLLGSVFEMTPQDRGPLFSFWFIESLIHAIVLTALLFVVPAFRSLIRTQPFATVVVLVLGATLFRWAGAAFWPNGNTINLTLDGWYYAFLLGWAIFFAKQGWQKMLVVGLAAALVFDQFGVLTGRAYWLTLAVGVMVIVPSLTVPRGLGRVLVYVAGATYFMYLVHAIVVHFVRFQFDLGLSPAGSMILVYTLSLGVGILAAEVWRQIMFGAQAARARVKRPERQA